MMDRRTKRLISMAGTVLFLLYLAALVYFLFFSEEYGRTAGAGQMHYNLVPFREILRFIRYRSVLGTKAVVLNLGGNVAGFMPFGLILPVMHRHLRRFPRTVMITALFSISVELVQLMTRVGSCDVDDVILNTLGGILGYGVFAVCNFWRKKIYV